MEHLTQQKSFFWFILRWIVHRGDIVTFYWCNVSFLLIIHRYSKNNVSVLHVFLKHQVVKRASDCSFNFWPSVQGVAIASSDHTERSHRAHLKSLIHQIRCTGILYLRHRCWDIPAAAVESHGPEQTHRATQTLEQHTHTWRNTEWLTLAHTSSWCSRWLAITRTPSVNSHRLWCYYTLSSQRGSAISPLMTMIHSVWSDNSIYTPANDWEWKSERMIAAYVGATASVPTQSVHNTHTHKLYRSNHDCPYTLLCCPSVLWPLPTLSLSRLQSSKLRDSMGENPGAFSYTYQQTILLISTENQNTDFWQGSISDVFVCLLQVTGHSFLPSISLPCLGSSHLSLNRDWPTPKPTRHASSAPTCPATSSRTAWSTSCLLSLPASACSPSVASRARTTLMPAASTATGQ